MFVINQQVCTWCGGCASICPASAIVMYDRESFITEQCRECGDCAVFCPVSAIGPSETGAKESRP